MMLSFQLVGDPIINDLLFPFVLLVAFGFYYIMQGFSEIASLVTQEIPQEDNNQKNSKGDDKE